MSRYDYLESIRLQDTSFYALIMAAMRRADADNEAKLRAAWPEVWQEFYVRYRTPGGYLPEEKRMEW